MQDKQQVEVIPLKGKGPDERIVWIPTVGDNLRKCICENLLFNLLGLKKKCSVLNNPDPAFKDFIPYSNLNRYIDPTHRASAQRTVKHVTGGTKNGPDASLTALITHIASEIAKLNPLGRNGKQSFLFTLYMKALTEYSKTKLPKIQARREALEEKQAGINDTLEERKKIMRAIQRKKKILNEKRDFTIEKDDNTNSLFTTLLNVVRYLFTEYITSKGLRKKFLSLFGENNKSNVTPDQYYQQSTQLLERTQVSNLPDPKKYPGTAKTIVVSELQHGKKEIITWGPVKTFEDNLKVNLQRYLTDYSQPLLRRILPSPFFGDFIIKQFQYLRQKS